MFPQGFYIVPKNRQYQTSKTNSIFFILSAITSEIGGNEKDSLTKYVNESSIVAGTGFISPFCSEMGQRGEQPKENKKRTTFWIFFILPKSSNSFHF
jgi:hypothetical protein